MLVMKSVPSAATRAWFWLLAGLLVLYVALCTGNRDLFPQADAWEHHRAIKALIEQLWQPGNPTLASSAPSVRYSPYTVTLALIARTTGVDAYRVLSGAAVFNTVLLIAGVFWFLARLGRERSAAVALLIMVSLYGSAPGYANSYALADLPWHQVNPSAFAFGCTLMLWALFLGLLQGGAIWPRFVAISVLLSCALLDHGMTGLAALVGLGVFALHAERQQRRVAIAVVVGVAVVSLIVCTAWPWYHFIDAVRKRPDNEYWYNPAIVHVMLTRWCAPGLLLSLFALTCADRRNVSMLLSAAAACLLLGLWAMLVHSPGLARLPMPGLIFAHLALALFADESRVFDPRTWPARLAALVRAQPSEVAPHVVQTVLAVAVIGFLVPQLDSIAHEPHLGRPLLEALLRRAPKRTSIRPQLDRLLAPIGAHDVVLSDELTSWAVPSSRGRVVSALHFELFVPGQLQRSRDVDHFFGSASEDERRHILERYQVSYIVLNRAWIAPASYQSLLDAGSVVGAAGDLTLMNAQTWEHDRALNLRSREPTVADAPRAVPPATSERPAAERRTAAGVLVGGL
jgi:hypothetical protein